MTATYLQRGEALDYKNSTDALIKAGDIVTVGARIGVAGADIPAGETGAVEVEGVFIVPYADSGAAALGTDVYWNETGVTATKGESTTPAGYVAVPAVAGDSTVAIKIG